MRNQMMIVAFVVALLILLTNAVTWHELTYRSRAEIAGLPLIQVAIDFDAQSTSHATAVVAVADDAVGFVAMGGHATGFLAIGAIAIGGVAVGAVAVGGVAIGAIAAGPVALGALALGLIALGAVAVGGLANGALAFGFAALGPLAIGRFAAGFVAIGQYCLTLNTHDQRAKMFFQRYPTVLFRRLLGSAIKNREGVG
jgi:hypothetical protein